MHIKIRNRLITTPVLTILKQLQSEVKNGKLKDIDDQNKDNILITCPVHKDGFESKPSCRVFARTDDKNLEAGHCHCFSCGYSGSLATTINAAFDEMDPRFGEDWLIDRFGDTIIQEEELLLPIDIDTKHQVKYLDESVLTKYDYYHPYMWKRKLTKDVVDRFRVGYDMERKAITFPVYDEKHRLVMVTARSVETKRFYSPSNVDKPVYLLYDIIKRGVTSVVVCESQINALYARSLGFDSIGLFGTGSKKQLETLKKSGIRNYILCFDGDEAGQKGAYRFKKALGNDVWIHEIKMPPGKDLNDFEPEDAINLISS